MWTLNEKQLSFCIKTVTDHCDNNNPRQKRVLNVTSPRLTYLQADVLYAVYSTEKLTEY